MPEEEQDQDGDFAAQAAAPRTGGIVSEFLEFLGQNKKWWLAPILAAILLLGGLVFLAGGAAGPFVYTLF